MQLVRRKCYKAPTQKLTTDKQGFAGQTNLKKIGQEIAKLCAAHAEFAEIWFGTARYPQVRNLLYVSVSSGFRRRTLVEQQDRER